MFQSPDKTQAGHPAAGAGRRSSPRQFLRRITTFAVMAISVLISQVIYTQPVQAKSADLPNIILIMADDQGWGDVGYNGHPELKTPTLDAMAATGLRFDRFYSAAPVCSPTRGSVLTGRHPNRFACFSWGHRIRPQEITIAEELKRAGYRTGHFGKWHLGEVRSGSLTSPGKNGFDEWFSSPNFYENSPLMSHNGKVVQTQGEGSEVTVAAALNFIRAAAKKKTPFLAVVWFGSPHTPHIAIPEDRKRYAGVSARKRNYYGEITAMDRAVGHLRRELRTMKIADNTLLWYTSDNGSRRPGSTGGLSGQKGSLWEGGIRVPCLIEWPARIKSPRRIALPAGTVDIFSTLLEIAGLKPTAPSHPLDGISLLPLIEGKTTARSKPLGFWVYPMRGRPVRSTQILKRLAAQQKSGEKPLPSSGKEAVAEAKPKTDPRNPRPGNAAWIDGRYKLHRRVSRAGKISFLLFDLQKDPREKTDLAKMQPERMKSMRAGLARWQTSVLNSLQGGDYGKR